MKFFTLITLLFLLISCSNKLVVNEGQARLRIMHTNDHHGHYLPNGKGEFGMAPRKTLINRLREQAALMNSSHLLLSGGDINTGTMESDIFNAKPDFLGMKELGYDAMAVGNHEFDNSFQVIKQQRKWAGFPFLSANIFYKKTNKRAFNPAYIIKQFNGFRVGIFGLTTVDTPFKASYQKTRKLFDFKNIIEVSKEMVSVLKRKEKVDFIIVLTHVGHHGSATSNGDVKLAKAVDGIDVIVGGHSQEIINAEVHNDTVIIQAEDWGKYVGVLDIVMDKNDGIGDFKYELIPVNLKKKVKGRYQFVGTQIAEDQKMNKLFEPFQRKADIIGKQAVGKLTKSFDGARSSVRARQMPIAQFMGAALMDKVSGIDGAVFNGGSVRSGLEKGIITRKKLHAVHPYGNTIVTVKLSPEEFFNYIEFVTQYAKVDPQNLIGGYPQFINMKLNFFQGELTKISSKNGKWKLEKKHDKLIASKKEFVLATFNFLAGGGDDYPVITKKKYYTDTGFMINSAMMDYAEKIKIIKPESYEISDKDVLVGF